MTLLSEARARVNELKTEAASKAAIVKEALDARAPAEKRYKAFLAKAGKRPIIAHVGGRYTLMTLAGIAVEGYRSLDMFNGKKKADIYDAIDNGGVSLSTSGGGYGVSYKAKGLTPRLKTPDPAAVKTWQRAVAASKRADARAEAAQRAEDFALEAVFKTGTPIERVELVEYLTQRMVLNLAVEKHPYPHQAKHDLERLTTQDEWGPLFQAEKHLAHLKAGVEDEETCRTCSQARQQAIRDREQARVDAEKREALDAHIAALTEVRLLKCPTHGNKRMKVEYRDGLTIAEDDGRRLDGQTALVGFCLADRKAGPHLVLDRKQREKDQAKAEKERARKERAEAAKVAKAMKSRAPMPDDAPIPAGTWVEFTCPNCSWVSQDEAVDDPESGINVVSCPNCGTDWDVDAIKTRLIERKAA